jgi:hypothetical protein
MHKNPSYVQSHSSASMTVFICILETYAFAIIIRALDCSLAAGAHRLVASYWQLVHIWVKLHTNVRITCAYGCELATGHLCLWHIPHAFGTYAF